MNQFLASCFGIPRDAMANYLPVVHVKLIRCQIIALTLYLKRYYSGRAVCASRT